MALDMSLNERTVLGIILLILGLALLIIGIIYKLKHNNGRVSQSVLSLGIIFIGFGSIIVIVGFFNPTF